MAKVIIISAPSGTGKSTIIKWLMAHEELRLTLSVSCTSRRPRTGETDGVDYHFISDAEFRNRIDAGEFLEYEEVYGGTLYGTLKQQVEDKLAQGRNVVFDVDVKGGCRIKEYYGDRALSLFIQPPSIDTLRQRLTDRGTETTEKIEMRVARAAMEMEYAPRYDRTVMNDVLDEAEQQTLDILRDFLEK
ncbi:MAG: guanylate kinase [Prevotella sp.]|nr:guanylate kinase [Prevotella sp.]